MVGPTGDLFVLQGHGKGESLVLKFDKDGNFIKTFGKKGKGPGEFDLPHSLVFDAKGLLYIADRNNARIQVLDADGNYIRESKHPGTPCGLFMSADQHIWLAHGHTGQIMKLDLNGNVVGVMTGRRAGQDARQVRRGALHRGQPARRDFRRRHAELARAEVCEEVTPLSCPGRVAERRDLEADRGPSLLPSDPGSPLLGTREVRVEVSVQQNPFFLTNAPKSARCGTPYCRALSSDQP